MSKPRLADDALSDGWKIGMYAAALAPFGSWFVVIGSSVLYYAWRRDFPNKASAINRHGWMAFLLGLTLWGAIWFMSGCGPEVKTRQTSAPLCEPGKAEVCACPGGVEGSQICEDDGAGWGECECDPVPDGGTAGSSGAGGSAGSGSGGAGGSAPVECLGTCSGECWGQCTGYCTGECSGTCDNPARDGTCDGNCIGACKGICGGIGSVCDGMCDGTCS